MAHWVQRLPCKHEVLSLILKVALTTTQVRHDTAYCGGRNTRIRWGSLSSYTNQIPEFQISEKPFLMRKVNGAGGVTAKVALQLPHA